MTRYATASVVLAEAYGQEHGTRPELLDLTVVEDGTPVDLYAAAAALGHGYGPSFLGLTEARGTADGLAAARATLPEGVAGSPRYTVHPVLLDVCLQTLAVSALSLAATLADTIEDAAARTYLPVGIGAVRVLADPAIGARDGALVTGRLRVLDDAAEALSGDLRVVADDGTLLAEIHGVHLRRIRRDEVPEAPAPERDADDDWLGAGALRRQNPAAARQLVADRLRSRVAWVMGHDAADIDPAVPLSSLGVDSLMAVRAKNAVEHDVEIVLPVRLLLQGASLADLEAYLATELGVDVAPAPAWAPVAGPAAGGFVAGRDATERWMATVWEQALGTGAISATAPLAGLGAGDDGRREALRLVRARLDHQPGAGDDVHGPFDEAAFLAAGTVEQAADLVRVRLEDVDGSPVRVLAPGTAARPPLFVFHPAGGTTSVYFSLASQLGDDQPVYGFERLDGLPAIEDKVARYVELIREIQPQGPYRLGGWSFGGALAYETARHLTAAGHAVEVVFLIDTILARKDGQSEKDMLRGRFGRFLEYLEETYGARLDVDVDALVELPEEQQMATMLTAFQASGLELSPALLEHQRTSYEDARTAEKFAPQPYDGRVVLYRAGDVGLSTTLDPRYARTEDALGWDLYCPRLEIVKIPGNHTSLIDPPHVDVMARHLSQLLSEVLPHA